MKCFTVTESKAYPYIPVATEPYRHVGVGERGRGRTYGMVAVGAKDFPTETEITAASVILTKAKQTLILVKEAANDTSRALVALKVSAGYRGSTSFSGVVFNKVPCPNRGEEIICDLNCRLCSFAIPREGDNRYIHPQDGWAYDWPAFPPQGVKVLAKGYTAQGGAGRMGGHEESLLIMEPGSMIRVSRGGRLYGAPSKVYIAWTGEEMLHGDHAYLMHKMGITEVDAQEGELV